MGVPSGLQAYIGLILVLGNLNLDKIPSSRASEWGSLRWVRTGLAQKAVVMQKFPGQPSSLLGGDNRLVHEPSSGLPVTFLQQARCFWHSFGKYFLWKLRDPKEWLLLVVVAMCVTCSDVCNSWAVGGAGTLVFSGQALLHLASWTGKTISCVLDLKRHLVCKQLS